MLHIKLYAKNNMCQGSQIKAQQHYEAIKIMKEQAMLSWETAE